MTRRREFEPNGAFVTAMRGFIGLTIVAVSEHAKVSDLLKPDGHIVLSWTGFSETVAGSVVVIIRPGVGLETFIGRVMAKRPRAIVYVGLQSAIETELAGYAGMFTLRARSVGADGERMYVYDLNRSRPRLIGHHIEEEEGQCPRR